MIKECKMNTEKLLEMIIKDLIALQDKSSDLLGSSAWGLTRKYQELIVLIGR